MKSPLPDTTQTGPCALDPEVLHREGLALLEEEIRAAGRGDYAEALRLNSVRLGLAEYSHAELLKRFCPAGYPAAIPELGNWA